MWSRPDQANFVSSQVLDTQSRKRLAMRAQRPFWKSLLEYYAGQRLASAPRQIRSFDEKQPAFVLLI